MSAGEETVINVAEGHTKYDYEAIVNKLRHELLYLAENGVTSLHPRVVLSYLSFIAQEERAKCR